jgi:hypothetical protein
VNSNYSIIQKVIDELVYFIIQFYFENIKKLKIKLRPINQLTLFWWAVSILSMKVIFFLEALVVEWSKMFFISELSFDIINGDS